MEAGSELSNPALKRKLFYLLLILLSFITVSAVIISCKKGDNGAEGPAGPQGTAGVAGATGADGTKVYSGTGGPAATLGKAGDFYLNLSNSDFYGPKAGTTWGSPINLKGNPGTNGTNGTNGAAGATGATGAAGSKIYSGNTAPAIGLGANGDYYLNTATYLFYGPKTSGTWPAPINMKGPKGDPGTANVIYSDWFSPPAYKKDTVYDIVGFHYDRPEPKITADILNKGVVLVYAKLNMYNTFLGFKDNPVQLPYQFMYMGVSSPGIDIWNFILSVGNIKISITSSLNAYTTISAANQYRYVVIPGGISVLSSINPKNYDQVKKVLQLKE